MGSSRHPLPCSPAAYMSMCVRECILHYMEQCVSEQWPTGGDGVSSPPRRREEIRRHTRVLEKWIGQREKEYELLTYAEEWEAHALSLVPADPPVERDSLAVSLRAFSSQSSEKMVRLRSYKPTHNGRSVCVGQHNKGRMACCFLIKNVKGLGFKHHSFFYFPSSLSFCDAGSSVAFGCY